MLSSPLSLFPSAEKAEQVLEKTPHLPREAPVNLPLHAAYVRRLRQGLTVLRIAQYPLMPQITQDHVGALQHPVQVPVRVVDLARAGEHGGEECAFAGSQGGGRLI